MPVLKQAKKALRVSKQKHIQNDRRRRAMREAVKAVRDLAAGGNKKEAQGLLPGAFKAIDKAAKSGVIKKNTAARKKSRLSRVVA